MRRWLAILILAATTAAYGAVPKVTITGKVIAPDGLTYAGSINCVMSAPATAMDGGTSVRVQSTGTLTIASDGTVSGALVANDITTPVTSYTCTTRINRTPVYTQTELIYLTTGSGTVDWGAISRPGATPYTPVGVSGSSGAVQSSNGTGGLQDSGVTASGGAVAAKSVNGTRYAHLFASSGSGTDASPWSGTPNPVQAAINDCGELTGVKGGCHVVLVPGVYDLGNGSYGLAVDSSSGPVSSVVIEGMGGPGVDTFTTSNSTVVLKYSGTGTAIQLGDFTADGTQNRITGATFRNFKVIQVGTAGTGVGIFGRTLRRSLIENVQIINFLDGLVLNTVSDFNRINAVTITGSGSRGVAIGTTSSSGSAYTFSDGNGNCNGNVFTGLDVQRDSSGRTGSGNGITIENVAEGTVIRDSRFHFFSTSPQAAIWLGAARNVTIDGNYFEDNYRSIYIFGMASYGGGGPVTISNNYISKIQFRAIDSATADGATTFINGITITGNDFSTYYGGASSTAIRLDAGARRVWIQGNTFTEGGGRTITQTNITTGATYITLPDASGTVVLDPNVTPPTTAAGYAQSGDSQGLQFFPGARRSYAEVLSLKQRGESPNQAPTSVRVFVLGDSISAMSTRSALRTWDKRFRLGGAGFDPLDSLTYAGAPEIATRTISGWTTTYGTNGGGETAPTTQLQMGIGGGSLFQSGTTGANVQVAYALTKVACNKIRIWYAKFAGAGSFQYRRDGGAWTTVATANASTDAGYVQVSLESTPIAGHTIDIGFNNGTTGQPGGNGVYIYGIESYTDYTGGDDQFDTVVPVWMSHGGATASRWASYVGSNQILTTFFTTVAPTQGFIALGTNDACTTRGGGATNDCTAGDSATTYSTNVQTIITALASYLPKKTDIVLQSPFARGYDDCTGEMATFATRIDGYRTALFALATTNGVSVWDMRKYWPSFTDANALGMYNAGDCTHPHYWSQALISSGWADLFSRTKGWQGQEQWRQARNCDFNNVGIYGTATIDMGHCDFLLAAGNGTLGTINTCSSDTVGRRITIGCQSGATWTAATPGAGNVKLHTSAFTCGTPASQYASISFICSPDGFRWIETGRSKGM